MDGSTVYVCDSDALINIQRHFPRMARRVKQLAVSGLLMMPEGVFRDLMRGTDRLASQVSKWKSQAACVVSFRGDARLCAELTAIESKYGDRIAAGGVTYNGFWQSPAGRKAAEGQVLALAKVRGHAVVSNDRALLLACMLEDVTCVVWTEFARRLGLVKTGRQTELPL